MNLDLSRALHDAVDGPLHAVGPGHARGGPIAADTDLAIGDLTSRIRRRRTVRAAVRGGIGVAATGAVAFAGMQVVGRRGPDDVLPPAVAGAAAGDCGSNVDQLTSTGNGPVVSLEPERIFEAASDQDPSVGLADRIDPLVGRTLAASVSYRDPRAATDDTTTAATVEINDTAGTPLLDPTVLVARDGVVVSLPQQLTQNLTWWSQTIWGSQIGFVGDLVTCSTPDHQGGDDLPSGDYDVYATTTGRDPVSGDTWRSVSPLVTIHLLPEEPLLTGLPARFPADVPIIGGKLIEVHELDGTTADGWTVTVAVDGRDGLRRAQRALAALVPTPADRNVTVTGTGSLTVQFSSQATSPDGAYSITVSERTIDGQQCVLYRLSPTAP